MSLTQLPKKPTQDLVQFVEQIHLIEAGLRSDSDGKPRMIAAESHKYYWQFAVETADLAAQPNTSPAREGYIHIDQAQRICAGRC